MVLKLEPDICWMRCNQPATHIAFPNKGLYMRLCGTHYESWSDGLLPGTKSGKWPYDFTGLDNNLHKESILEVDHRNSINSVRLVKDNPQS